MKASPNYHVIVASRDLAKGKAAVAEIEAGNIKGTLSCVQLNVTDEASIDAAAKAVESDFGKVDVLINNAGIVSRSPSFKQQLLEDFETNAMGAALVTEGFKPLLKASSRGRLIFVTSGLGSISMRTNPDLPFYEVTVDAYRASKSAMNMLQACYLKELGATIKVHGVCPGYVATNLGGSSTPAPGTGSPYTSGNTILKIVEGDRDAEVGRVVHKDGVYDW